MARDDPGPKKVVPLSSRKSRGSPDGESKADTALRLTCIASFYNDRGTAYAVVPDGDHEEVFPVKSESFDLWHRNLFWSYTGKALPDSVAKEIRSTCIARALFDGEYRRVYRRVARVSDDQAYIALYDSQRRVVCVQPDGWRIVASKESPLFFKPPQALELAAPEKTGADIALLRSFTNIDEGEFILLVSAITFMLAGRGPFPVLVLSGEQGSGKSFTTLLVQMLVDNTEASLRGEPRDFDDLTTAAANCFVLTIDNVSYISAKMSDMLCRMVTGGSFSKRRLYSDTEEVVVEAMRPIVMNGIGHSLVSRADLLDRAIVIEHNPIQACNRRAHTDYWKDFHAVRPRIFAALLDGVVQGIKGAATVRLDEMPRLADFARWGVAAAAAFDWRGDDFLAAYNSNISAARTVGVESSSIGEPLIAFLEKRDGWTGHVKDLWFELSAEVSDATVKSRGWPDSPRMMGEAVRRVSPALRAVGWDAKYIGRDAKGRRYSFLHLGVTE